MSTESIYNDLFEACRKAIVERGETWFTVTLDDYYDEEGTTMIDVTCSIDEDFGTISIYDMKIDSGDYDGNEIVTERAALADRIDVLALEKELNDYFRAA